MLEASNFPSSFGRGVILAPQDWKECETLGNPQTLAQIRGGMVFAGFIVQESVCRVLLLRERAEPLK